jgi:hypothetical protein
LRVGGDASLAGKAQKIARRRDLFAATLINAAGSKTAGAELEALGDVVGLLGDRIGVIDL